MPVSNPMPFLVTETTPTGDPRLAGKRRLEDDIDHAATIAEQIGGQVFALEAVEPNHFAPKPSIAHVALATSDGPAALPAPVETVPEVL